MQNLGFLEKLLRQTSVRTSGFQWLITQIEMQADKQKFCKRQKAFIGKDGYLQTIYCFNEQLRTTQLLLLSTRSFIPGYFPFWKQETKPSETSYCEMMLNKIVKPCDTKKTVKCSGSKKAYWHRLATEIGMSGKLIGLRLYIFGVRAGNIARCKITFRYSCILLLNAGSRPM